jgi:hypothetical protein
VLEQGGELARGLLAERQQRRADGAGHVAGDRAPRLDRGRVALALEERHSGHSRTYLPSAYTRAPDHPAGLSTAWFSPPLYDTFAIITRAGARLSPGVRELLADLETHMRAIAERLDRSR